MATIKKLLKLSARRASNPGKCWVARITGGDPTYGLARSFIDAADTSDRHSIAKSWELSEGCYEVCVFGARTYRIAKMAKDGSRMLWLDADKARVEKYARSLDAGMSEIEACEASKPQG